MPSCIKNWGNGTGNLGETWSSPDYKAYMAVDHTGSCCCAFKSSVREKLSIFITATTGILRERASAAEFARSGRYFKAGLIS